MSKALRLCHQAYQQGGLLSNCDLAELLNTWLWRWVAFLIVFGTMVLVGAVLALLGFLKVRRIRGPQQTIESVKETRTALTPGHDKAPARELTGPDRGSGSATSGDPTGW